LSPPGTDDAARGADSADRGRRAFRSADDFAVEAHRAADGVVANSRQLADAIREAAARAAASVAIAAAVRGGSRSRLLEARDTLVEARYLLHLARRTGVLDARRFRPAASRHDSALRDLESWIREGPTG